MNIALNAALADATQIELCNMIVECCSQERSYSNFYGLIGERFCKLNRVWTDNFQEAFQKYYDTIHRYETNKLRNIGRFFGHLLASDGISWAVLHVVHMNEEETTSSSRIFVKILMQEMLEEIGIKTLVTRFKQPDMQPAFANMFPVDNPRNTRFSINYFTSIGLGAVTEDMRMYLQNAPKLIAAQRAAQLAAESDSDSDSDSSSSDSSSDLSSSESDSETDSRSSYDSRKRGGGGRKRSPSYSRSPKRRDSPPRRKRYSSSPPPRRSPSPRRRRNDDTPPAKERRDDSPSPPPRRRVESPRARRDSPPRRRVSSPRRRSPSPRRRSPSPRRRYDDRSPRRNVRDERENNGRDRRDDRR